MRCARAGMTRRAVDRDRRLLYGCPVIDQRTRAIDLPELLALRQNLLPLRGKRGADLLAQCLSLGPVDRDKRGRVFQWSTHRRQTPCVQQTLLAILLRDRFALHLVAVEKLVSRPPTQPRNELPHQIVAVL